MADAEMQLQYYCLDGTQKTVLIILARLQYASNYLTLRVPTAVALN